MNVDLGLKDKVAVVTGAGGGIGREIALSLAKEGVSIVVNDIGVSLTGEGGSESPAQETVGLITQKGGKAIKTVDKEKNPGLAKLPTKVRNKMGYMKKGGRVGMGKAMRGGGCVR